MTTWVAALRPSPARVSTTVRPPDVSEGPLFGGVGCAYTTPKEAEFQESQYTTPRKASAASPPAIRAESAPPGRRGFPAGRRASCDAAVIIRTREAVQVLVACLPAKANKDAGSLQCGARAPSTRRPPAARPAGRQGGRGARRQPGMTDSD